MGKKLFISSIAIQFLIIIFLGINIYKKKNIKGITHTNPVSKSLIISSPSGDLKHFFEPNPNSTFIDDWLNLYNGPYHINSDTLREDREYPISKPPRTFRIIALGDSFTFGNLVALKNTWPKQLEQQLNSLNCPTTSNFEVINLGVGAYDMEYEVERFRVRGKKYDPDLILWFLIENDFIQINELMFKNKNDYEWRMRENGEYDKATREGDLAPVWTRITKEMAEKYNELGEDKIVEIHKNSLSQLRAEYKQRLVIFTLPNTPLKWKKLMESFADSSAQSFYFTDIRDIYKMSGTFSPADPHPNPKGYKIISEDLLKYLVDNKIVPCS